MANPEKRTSRFYKVSQKTIIYLCVVLVIALGLSFWLGWQQAVNWARGLVLNIHPVRENNDDEYQFISPLLLYNFGDASQFFEDKNLESKINTYVQQQYKNQNAENISVAVRDFVSRRWAGIDQEGQYHPGSMMKVIIMMGYFRQTEADPNFLNKTLVYDAGTDQQTKAVPFAMQPNLSVGKSYTTSYLLQDMIGNSDNGAETLLLNNLDSKILNQVYVDLNIASPDAAGNNYTISPSQYMDFLRILYNSTYLTEKYSEQALSIMSESTYRDGITAGVPAGIVVAQKYGEHVNASGNVLDSVELSNCGIVYAKDHPYSICVMTKKKITTTEGSDDEKKLAGIIKDISGIVYNYAILNSN